MLENLLSLYPWPRLGAAELRITDYAGYTRSTHTQTKQGPKGAGTLDSAWSAWYRTTDDCQSRTCPLPSSRCMWVWRVCHRKQGQRRHARAGVCVAKPHSRTRSPEPSARYRWCMLVAHIIKCARAWRWMCCEPDCRLCRCATCVRIVCIVRLL